jgi:arylsulfatase
LRPEDKPATPYTEWNFSGPITRMPEGTAPALGNRPNTVTYTADLPANANGVLYALGGFSGGLALYMLDGTLCYEYNLFEIERTQIRSSSKLPAGKATIEVVSGFERQGPNLVGTIAINVNGKQVASGTVPRCAPLLFTANDCLDLGSDLGSAVSTDYYDKAPFKLNGTVESVHVKYAK